MISRFKRVFSFWIEEKEDFPNNISEELRITISFENLFLFVRYLLLFIVISLYIVGLSPESYMIFFVFVGVVMFHNLFVHLVLYLNKPSMFITPICYVLHLASITASVVATGYENSPLFVGYVIFQHIYLFYSMKKPHPMITTLIILILYNFSIISVWGSKGLTNASFLLLAQNGILILSGITTLLLNTFYQHFKERFFQMEQELVYSQGVIKSIIESIRTPIIIFDDSEIIVETNSYTLALLQQGENSLIGKRIRRIFFDDLMMGDYLSLLKSTGELNIEAIVITEEGSEIPVQFIVRRFYKSNKPYYLGILLDKREHKKLQEITTWVRKQREELEEKVRKVQELQISFSEALFPRIFTNLTTLRNSIKILSKETYGPLNEKQRLILESARKALTLLEEDLQKEVYRQEVQIQNYDI